MNCYRKIARAVITSILCIGASAAFAQRSTVTDVDFLGVVEIPSGTEFNNTVIGGLSGIVRDPTSGNYLAVSDDRGAGDDGTPRVYKIAIDVSDRSLDDGDVTFQSVHSLRTQSGETLDVINPDPEGIAIDGNGQLYISSERNSDGRIPQLFKIDNGFAVSGELDVPGKFKGTAGDRGVRNNLGFESLTVTPDGSKLYAATEAALLQDGNAASLSEGSNARVIEYEVETGAAIAEYIYQVDPIAEQPNPRKCVRRFRIGRDARLRRRWHFLGPRAIVLHRCPRARLHGQTLRVQHQ